MTGIKYTDLKIVRDETGAVVTVKSASVDSKDNTKVTIETYEALTDGKAYTVTYTAADEAKTESSANFTATAGVVADIALNTYSIPANTPTTIKYQLLDANGVLIEEKGIGKSKSDKIDVSIENFNGYQSDDTLVLYTTGDKAKLKVVYHTWKYNNTDGKEDGMVEKSFEITAVDPSNVIETYEYSIAQHGTAVDFKRDTLKKQLALEDDKGTADPWAYFYFCKADGTEITKNLDYTVSSGNENVLLANGSVADGAQLTPVGVGATYLMIKDTKGTVIKTLPITVVAKRELSTMTVDKSSVTVAQNGSSVGTQRITIAVMDQYSDAYTKYTPGKLEIKNGKDDSKLIFNVSGPSHNKTYVDVYSNGAEAGTYVYTLELVDDEKGTNVKKVTFSVTVSKNLTSNTTYGLVIMDAAQEHIVSKVDTTVYAGGHTAITLKPTIVEKNNGSITGKADIGGALCKVASYGALTLSKNGVVVDKKYYDNTGNNETATDTAIRVTEKIAAPAAYITPTGDFPAGSQIIVKNLAAGTYTLTLTAMVAGKKQNMSTSFQVEDSQKVFEANVKDESVEKNFNTLNAVFEDTNYVAFSYAGHVIDKTRYPYYYASAETTYTNVKKALRVKKVSVDIMLPGTGDQIVRMTTDVNRTFTFVDDIVDASSVSNSINEFNSTYTDKNGSLLALSNDKYLAAIAKAVAIQKASTSDKLTDAEQKALKASVDKAVAVAQNAAVKVLTTAPASANKDVYEILGYTDGGESDYESAEIANYNVLADGVLNHSITLTATSTTDPVKDTKTKLENIFTKVANAKAAVAKDCATVTKALPTVVSGSVVTKEAVEYSCDIKAVSESSITIKADVKNATSGDVDVTSISAIKVTTPSAMKVKVELTGDNVSGSGVEFTVSYDITVSKTVGSGEYAVTYYASAKNGSVASKINGTAASFKDEATYYADPVTKKWTNEK